MNQKKKTIGIVMGLLAGVIAAALLLYQIPKVKTAVDFRLHAARGIENSFPVLDDTSFQLGYQEGSSSVNEHYRITRTSMIRDSFNCGQSSQKEVSLSDEDWKRLVKIMGGFQFSEKGEQSWSRSAGAYETHWALSCDGVEYKTVDRDTEFKKELSDFCKAQFESEASDGKK